MRVLSLPYLLGERTLGSATSRGVFFGFHPRHGRAHAARAILEGICFDLRQSLEIARKPASRSTRSHRRWRARSEFWSGIKADVYALPVAAIEHEEAGILEAAMLAMVGAGVFSLGVGRGSPLVGRARGIEPDVEAIARNCDRHYRLFRTLHDRLQSVYRGSSGHAQR